MAILQQSASVVVARPPEDLYDMVADVTRMGEWSPVCKACWWDEGDGPRVGAWFTGRNEMGERTWETRCEVVVADRGRGFAFVVAETGTRWGYTFTPVDAGTQLTEWWAFPPSGVALFEEQFGPIEAEALIAQRSELSRTEIAGTLAAIKRVAEAG
jgi:hypothetical protein